MWAQAVLFGLLAAQLALLDLWPATEYTVSQ